MRRTSLGLCIAVAIGFGGQASAQPPPLQVFATGDIQAQGIVPSGESFLVVNTNGKILSVPLSGGVATHLTNIPIPPATSCTNCLSLRDGTFLPHTFGANAGKLLVVGGVAQPNTPAFASTVANNLDVTPYATQPSSLWSASVVATGFGRYTLGVLVVNQGSGQSLRNGGVNFFGPDGSVSLLAALPDAEVPYGAALVRGFGDVSNNLLISDARSGRIYSITPNAKVELFATVPLAAGQTGLRQIALAPPGWGRYSGHLFVSIAAGEVAVLDKKGVVVGKITGLVAPRSLRFTELGGVPSLLIGETGGSLRLLYRAGPEHIVPVP